MKVCKFGGSSLADAGQLTKVIDIVLADPQRRIVVVSAPGKRNKSDTKVTDLLITLAQKALAGADTTAALAAVVARYSEIATVLDLGTEIVKVDGFLNHQIDVKFLEEIGAEFGRRFAGVQVDKILTVEASGIAIACAAAPEFNYAPVVFAKKAAPSTMNESNTPNSNDPA